MPAPQSPPEDAGVLTRTVAKAMSGFATAGRFVAPEKGSKAKGTRLS